MNGLTCMTRLYYAPYTPTAMPGLWGKPQLLADELRYKENLPETMAGLLETLAGLHDNSNLDPRLGDAVNLTRWI